MPAPHINPPVMIVSTIRKSAVSNRVIVQSCRIVRLNCWTANEQDGPELLTDGFNEALSSHIAAQVPLPGTRPKRRGAVSSRQVQALGQDQEPEASCDVHRDGRACLSLNYLQVVE